VESAGRSAASLWSAARPVFEEPPTAFPQSSLWDTTVNLTNAVLGAGLLALPHAYAGLGVLGGVLLTAAVGLMTHASIALMLR
jgi:amino acid permease